MVTKEKRYVLIFNNYENLTTRESNLIPIKEEA
jgi:hypothetical protein